MTPAQRRLIKGGITIQEFTRKFGYSYEADEAIKRQTQINDEIRAAQAARDAVKPIFKEKPPVWSCTVWKDKDADPYDRVWSFLSDKRWRAFSDIKQTLGLSSRTTQIAIQKITKVNGQDIERELIKTGGGLTNLIRRIK